MPATHLIDDHFVALLVARFGANVPGMYKIGTRAWKSLHVEPGDDHAPGAACIIAFVVPVGSVPEHPNEGAYFVHWDDLPGALGFVISSKLVGFDIQE
jgi:hypothetical protein